MTTRKIVWLCVSCGRQGPTRESVGDESCYMHSVLVYEDSIVRTDRGVHAACVPDTALIVPRAENRDDAQPVWIQTYLGRQMRIPEWNHDAITLTETATVLSRICRWGGRTGDFYSVAEHSVRVAACVRDLGGTPLEQFIAINHEGDEALLGFDPPAPMLKLLPDLSKLKRQAHESYMRRYGLPLDLPRIVKRADAILLATERRDLMMPCPDGVEWKCAEEPLADRIVPWAQPIDPHAHIAHAFMRHWRLLARAAGYSGSE